MFALGEEREERMLGELVEMLADDLEIPMRADGMRGIMVTGWNDKNERTADEVARLLRGEEIRCPI